MFLLNSFSLNMLVDMTATVRFTEIDETSTAAALAQSEWTSAVGHADTAAILSNVLGLPVPCNRVTVTLKAGDRAIVGQYKGPRLAEGATELPEGAEIKWVTVEVSPVEITLEAINAVCKDAWEYGLSGGHHGNFDSLASVKEYAAKLR